MPTRRPSLPPPADSATVAATTSTNLQELVDFAQPSHALTSNDVRSLARHAMALKENLANSAQRLLREAQNAAMLCWYSNDTTPM
eukprot:7224693-Heterocapsa_arctica.AAC.1